ncbi:hypothetical protein AQUCO_01700391v1 [Aquilegia coerulea]|uniref:Disease resistance protein RGA3 n=1 Tax=Aquilegia coerulea TaxID=218851 RepID=A0A2G5DML6_AQUCA|nr:hypothetical protein AQUCO_01700391v1 [Aquilegia coerulea]
MADALLGILSQNLITLAQNKFGLLYGVEEDIEKLSSTLSTIRDVVDDAEMKQGTDKAIGNWLRKLKDVAYEADDVLDEWLTEVRRADFELTTKLQVSASSSSSCFPSINKPAFGYKIAKRIKKTCAKFDQISRERSNFHLQGGVVERVGFLDPNRETSSVIVETNIYGRDEEKGKIVNMLISNMNSQNNVSVISICGIGGLGKTALAQLVYNNEMVSNHFGVRIWICVAEDFAVKRILKLILESLSDKAVDLEGLNPMQTRLRELLSGKRFLLVLDDVWNRDQDKWDKLKFSLACGSKGSSIMVTTRLHTTALIMSTLPVFLLTPLSENDCWSLFKGRVLGMGNDNSLTAKLEEMGRQIVKKCGGVPLAAKVLGALLCFKREVSEWLSIRDSDIWELQEEEGDYSIKKEVLIQLWMANGFVQCIGKKEFEEVGNQIFNDLLHGSFFQEVQKDDFGNIICCKMHDLMHDLACSLTATECCRVTKIDKMTSTIPKSFRHLSMKFSDPEPRSRAYYKSLCKSNKLLRTHLFVP